MQRRAAAAIAIALAAVTVTALTGCGGAGGGQVSDDGKGKVVVWYLPFDADFMAKIKPIFEKDNPGITLETVSVPEDEYVTKIDTAMLAQQPPDIVFEYDAKWIKSGRVLPVNGPLKAAGVDLSSFNQVAMHECVYKDKTYCMGSLGGATMLIYNKAMFDAAGIAYPSATKPMTLQQYADLAAKLTKPDPDPAKQVYGSDVDSPLNGLISWSTFYGKNAKSAVGNLDSARTIKFFDILTKMARDGVSAPPSIAGATAASDLLATGNVAMAINDMESCSKAMDGAGLAWGAAPPPVVDQGDKGYMFVGTDKYAALKGGTNNAGAEKFLVWLAKNGGKLRVADDTPPLDSAELAAWAGKSDGRKQVLEVLKTASTPTLFVPSVWDISGGIGDTYNLLASGEKTDAASALKELAPQLQAKLDDAWKTWDAIK